MSLRFDASILDVRQAINLDESILEKLSTRHTFSFSWRFLSHFLIIFIAIFSAYQIPHWTVYIIALMVIGAHQIGLGTIALHEGAHNLILKNRKYNDLFSKLLSAIIFGPIFIKFDINRQGHFLHHRLLNKKEDTDLLFFEYVYELPNWVFTLMLLVFLSGIGFIYSVFKYVLTEGKASPISATSILLILAMICIGHYHGHPMAMLIFKFWLIPLATWGSFINFVRIAAEHYPKDIYKNRRWQPRAFLTRDTLLSTFDRVFVVTGNINLHLTHHLYPEVPFYHLAKLQKVLAQNKIYQQYAIITHGYHGFLKEFYCDRNNDKKQLKLKRLFEMTLMPTSLYKKLVRQQQS